METEALLERFHEFLKKAVSAKASDVHFKAGLPPVVRHNEKLQLLSKSLPPLSPQATLDLAMAIMPEKLKPRFEAGLEVDMAYSLPGVGRFRLNIFRHRSQVGLICRFIPFDVPELSTLGLPAIVSKLSLTERGLVLVTGAAGSGKSTTLAAMIQEWNRLRGGHIVTIEDPVEYLIRDKRSIITQREVGIDTESFESGLKNALRQDPDVIMIGELRERDSIQAALNAAETGHLVLATLHTRDAIETVQRVVGAFFPADSQPQIRIQLANALKAVVSQRLIPKIGGGLAVACEVLVNTGRARELLMDATKTALLRDVMESGGQYGMQSFDESIMGLLRGKVISKEEALQAASHPADFELRLRGIKQSSEHQF